MTAFALALSPAARPALGVVAAHGLTDFGSRALVPSYALALACPMPSSVVTALFCAASVLHLADELGLVASLGLHALTAVIDRVRGHDDAFGAFLCYLATLHTPCHYVCEWRRGRRALVVFSALAGATLACLWSPYTYLLAFSPWAELFVLACCALVVAAVRAKAMRDASRKRVPEHAVELAT